MSILNCFDTEETIPALIHLHGEPNKIRLPLRRAKLGELLVMRERLSANLERSSGWLNRIFRPLPVEMQRRMERDLEEINQALNTIPVEWTVEL